MNSWGRFAEPVRDFVRTGALESVENSYKRKHGQILAEARRLLLAGESGWETKFAEGINFNLLFYVQREKLKGWIRTDSSAAESALKAIWSTESSGVAERIRNFFDKFPVDLVTGLGSRTNLVSVLLMGVDAERFPPYRATVFNEAYSAFEIDIPGKDFDEAETYEFALRFLRKLVDGSGAENLAIRHPLDAQSAVWMLHQDGLLAGPVVPRRRNIWLMALGPQSEHWESFYEDGIAAIGWDHLGDLRQHPDQRHISAAGLGVNDSLACWEFSRVMAPGDVILIRQGRKDLVGGGIVNSEYSYDDLRPVFKHVRQVDWRRKIEPAALRRDGRALPLKTLTNISSYQYAQGAKEILDWDWDESSDPSDGLSTLAANLFMPDASFLEGIVASLRDNKQVIFQGPPGTGKTYIAKALATHLAGSDDRVDVVQFHPSYGYEDFIQGIRPVLTADTPKFELRNGPLLHAAERATRQPEVDHFLVIDEINRGNLAKVFGELYFLLEYRGERIRLLYQDTTFELPPNLYFIGTMNTADRSIALVDAALRRRFFFHEFHPDHEPVRGVLRRWLRRNAPAMEWVADVVESANELLQVDRHAAIGPSYFMKLGLDDHAVERIWKYSVLPYIEERLYGDHERIREFEMSSLRSRISGPRPGESEGNEPENE